MTEWSYVDVYIIPYGESVCNFRHKRRNKRLCTGFWTFSNLDRGFKLRFRSSTSILHLYRTCIKAQDMINLGGNFGIISRNIVWPLIRSPMDCLADKFYNSSHFCVSVFFSFFMLNSCFSGLTSCNHETMEGIITCIGEVCACAGELQLMTAHFNSPQIALLKFVWI